eukprot:6645113-Prorocentrum_lima.AAC.1
MRGLRRGEVTQFGDTAPRLLLSSDGCHFPEETECVDPQASHFPREGGKHPVVFMHGGIYQPIPAQSNLVIVGVQGGLLL